MVASTKVSEIGDIEGAFRPITIGAVPALVTYNITNTFS
jgi:hypothetical protein